MDLLGRHILREGTWNDVTFTKQDLDDIVNNFHKLKEVHHVPLKFGHNDDQKVTDGQPAIGWIERVYRKGEDLFADFAHVPQVVMDAIKAKRYRTVSIEVMKDAKLNGEEIKTWFLDAVALLGADQPAVSGLADLADLSFSRATIVDGKRVAFGKAGNFKSRHEESEMDSKELQAAIDKAVSPLNDKLDKVMDENATLKTEVSELKSKNATLETEAETRNKKDEAEKIAASRKAAQDVLDTAVRQKAINPAQSETIAKSFGIADDKRVMEINLDDIKSLSGWKEPKDDPRSTTMSRDDDDENDRISLDQQVVRATRKVMANKPDLNYSSAQIIALEADPELARNYANSNGVFTADGSVER
jgi:FtsZ-binding cell division protein ZapB